MFGDQTDVPESGDWWDASYLILWGSNVPVTRTPDAHWITEARYRGQKVVVRTPDTPTATKFADERLAPASGHGLRRSRWPWVTSCSRSSSSTGQTPRFVDYCKRYTGTCLSSSRWTAADAFVPDKFLTRRGPPR